MKLSKKLFYWIPVVFWMGVIFYFSSKTSVHSDKQSYFVIELINQLFRNLGLKIQLAAENYNFIIRKMGHICEYAILEGFLYKAFESYGLIMRRIAGYSIVTCILYAITDEIHQLFIEGRAGRLSDVGIDAFGGLIGLAIMITYGYRRGTKANQI